jgi:hypothetical protein
MKVSPADLDRQRACGRVGGVVLAAATGDHRGEGEHERQLST